MNHALLVSLGYPARARAGRVDVDLAFLLLLGRLEPVDGALEKFVAAFQVDAGVVAVVQGDGEGNKHRLHLQHGRVHLVEEVPAIEEAHGHAQDLEAGVRLVGLARVLQVVDAERLADLDCLLDGGREPPFGDAAAEVGQVGRGEGKDIGVAAPAVAQRHIGPLLGNLVLKADEPDGTPGEVQEAGGAPNACLYSCRRSDTPACSRAATCGRWIWC